MASDNIRSENNRDISYQNTNIDKDFINEALDRQRQIILDKFSHRFALSDPPPPQKNTSQIYFPTGVWQFRQFKFVISEETKLSKDGNEIWKIADNHTVKEYDVDLLADDSEDASKLRTAIHTQGAEVTGQLRVYNE